MHDLIRVSLWAVFFFGTEQFSKRFLSELKKNIKGFDRKDFDTRIVSSVHAVLSLWGILPVLMGPKFGSLEYNPAAAKVLVMSVGFFVWDSYRSISYYKNYGFGFAFHGLMGLTIFSCALMPFMLYYACVFLFFEASTVFLNAQWFMKKTGNFKHKFFKINGLACITVFFLVRLVYGPYKFIGLYADLQEIKGYDYLRMYILVSSVGLTLLNLFWLYKMIFLVIRMMKDESKKKK